MSYDPKLYLIKYSVNDEYEDDVFQAEDAYEAISQLHINVPNANVDAVYVKVDLYDEEEEEEDDE